MLQIHSSNCLEVLLDVFTDLTPAPEDPLEPQTLVVQNAGMSRWIAQQTALNSGISANVVSSSPGVYLWDLPSFWDPQWGSVGDWSKEQLLWRVYGAIPALLGRPGFAELAHYLESDRSGSGLFQLARQIADTFDRYLVYRADLVARWESGQDRHWQAELWRTIRGSSDAPHWGDLSGIMAGYIEADSPPVKPLPARVALFGVSSLPPVHLDLLKALACFTHVDLYYLNPSREYWADIIDERGQARRRARAQKAGLNDPTGLLDLGNPLLASWGLAGQAFLDQLLESDAQECDYFVEPASDLLLHQVQRDMLNLADHRLRAATERIEIAATDRSIQLHSAHSVLREVQILHDQLLQLFQQLDDLQPRDIIVMAPSIEQYAPFIDATFSVVSAATEIPWTIADRPMRREQQILEVVSQLLKLPESRFESVEMLSLLDVPALARRLGLDSDTLGQLRTRVIESGIRWSLDGAMRESLELPAEHANSWDFGLQRLFAGYALPTGDSGLYAGVAAYCDVEGADAEQLAALQQLIDLCFKWTRRLQAEHTLASWLEIVDYLISDFFTPDDEERYVLNQLRAQMQQSAEQATAAGAVQPVSRAVLLELLSSILDDDSNSRNFLNGAVTFSNMVPMRSIPFRVVCLLGMNATSFPRDDRPLPFDLISQQPRRGDRSKHSDDRYLFLETLLSAREIFYLSFVGRDARDNSPRAAATVLEELQAYIHDSFRRADQTPAAATIEHPLQPFSRRYFDGSDSRLHNFKPQWFAAAGLSPGAALPVFYDLPTAVDEVPPELVDVADFIRFFKKPSQTFLRHRFGVSLLRADDVPQVSEPFELSGLEKWQLKQSVFQQLEMGTDRQTALALQRASGELPAGAAGDRLYQDTCQQLELFRERVALYRADDKPQDINIDLDIGLFNLVGVLNAVTSRGINWHRVGKLRAADLLEYWISHLLLNRQAPAGVDCQTVAVGETETWIFSPLANADELLREMAQIYLDGQRQPPPVFPETARAYACADEDARDAKALMAWRVGGGDGSDACVDILWRGRDPLGDEFRRISTVLFGTMMQFAEARTANDDISTVSAQR